jgi:hypothetical protein
MLSRFCICLFVNVVMQQFIYAWWYSYIGNPEQAKESIMGIMTLSRILKNLAMFPIESVVLTLFLRFLLPVTRRAKLTYCGETDMKFSKRDLIVMICLILVGLITATSYLGYRYSTSSRSADYSTEERVEINHEMAELVLDRTDNWDEETVVCIVDSAYRGLFQSETDYTVAVYVLDEEAFAAGQADNDKYTMDTLWAYSKSGPKKDKYQSLIKVASVAILKNEDTGEILDFVVTPAE